MQKISVPFLRAFQARFITQKRRQRKLRIISILQTDIGKRSSEKPLIPVWQITVPLSVVLIFAMGSYTACSIVGGRYTFDFSITREQISIRTDVDRRACNLFSEEECLMEIQSSSKSN